MRFRSIRSVSANAGRRSVSLPCTAAGSGKPAGRMYAAYGGVYVVVALLWLWNVERLPVTAWDVTGDRARIGVLQTYAHAIQTWRGPGLFTKVLQRLAGPVSDGQVRCLSVRAQVASRPTGCFFCRIYLPPLALRGDIDNSRGKYPRGQIGGQRTSAGRRTDLQLRDAATLTRDGARSSARYPTRAGQASSLPRTKRGGARPLLQPAPLDRALTNRTTRPRQRG